MGQGDGNKRDPDRPPSSPPELGDLDTGWDDDLPDPFGPLPGEPRGGTGRRSPERDAGIPDPFGPLPSQHLGEPDPAALDRNAAAPPAPPPEPAPPAEEQSQAYARTEPAPALEQMSRGQPLSLGSAAVPQLPKEPPPPSSSTRSRSIPEDALPLQGSYTRPGALPFGPAELLEESRGRAQANEPAAEPAPPQRPPRIPSTALQLNLDDVDEADALQLADRHTPIGLPRYAEPAPQSGPVAAAPTSPRADSSARGMKDRYAAGDYSGALVVAEEILASDPDHGEAQRYAQSCRDVLTQMYTSRLGSLERVPKVAVAPDQIRWLSLDHRAGFLLSLVDGISRIEDILDISSMPRLDALRILLTLFEQRVISLE